MKNKIKLKIFFTLFFCNFFFGKNLFENFKEKSISTLKKNWKKILSAHFVFSTFGAYRWKNKTCLEKTCLKCLNNKFKCFLNGFALNFIPLYFDISKLKNDIKCKNISHLSPFLPFYARQEIAFLITKEQKKDQE